jgi:hypothetical protein
MLRRSDSALGKAMSQDIAFSVSSNLILPMQCIRLNPWSTTCNRKPHSKMFDSRERLV